MEILYIDMQQVITMYAANTASRRLRRNIAGYFDSGNYEGSLRLHIWKADLRRREGQFFVCLFLYTHHLEGLGTCPPITFACAMHFLASENKVWQQIF